MSTVARLRISGGTSAGAVTAGLLAAGYTATDLEGVFGSKKYSDFLAEKTYTGFDDNPANGELLLALLEDAGYLRLEGITDPRRVAA